jgi:hypothetical protein
MTTLEYFKTLAMGLRLRKLSEDQVADVLRELQSHLQETGQRPEEAFGSPREYAARFPKGNTVSPGTKVAYLVRLSRASRPVPVVEQGTPGCAARLLARARIGSRVQAFSYRTLSRLDSVLIRSNSYDLMVPALSRVLAFEPAAERVDRECCDKSEGCSESRGRRPWCIRGSQDGLDSRPSGRPHPFR